MRRLLITRPADRADALCRMARARGWEPLPLPLFRIVPEQAPAELVARLAEHAAADWWIFTSTTAVDLVDEARPQRWARSAAIGAATAARLDALGHAPEAVPERRFDSEALLALPAFAEVAGQRIVLLGNASGRGALQRELAARGAEVHLLPVYRLEPESLDAARVSESLAATDVVLLTSGRAVTALWEACPADRREGLAELPIVVPSERVAQLAVEQGLRGPSAVAQPMSDSALLDAADTLLDMEDNTKASAKPPEDTHRDDVSATKPSTRSEGAETSASDPAGKAASGKVQAGGAGAAEGSPPPPRRRAGGALWLLLLLLVAGAMAAAGYWAWEHLQGEQQSQQERLRAMESRLGERLEGLDRLDAVSDEAARARRTADDALAKHGEQAQAVDTVRKEVERLRRAVDAGRVRTQALAAEQLLMQANERLLLARDAAGARTALRLADRRLASLDDPRFFAVREAIADEKMALGDVDTVDRTAIALRLSTLIRRADGLPLRGGVVDPEAPALGIDPVRDASEDTGFWARAGLALREALSGVFVVRRTDTPIEPLMAPEHQALVRGVLMLRLESARRALLTEDQNAYEEALRSAASWLEAQFASGDRSVDNAVAELRSLRQEQLVPPSPDISGSLTRLRDVLQRLDGEDG